jgi:ankyrin repeat protein
MSRGGESMSRNDVVQDGNGMEQDDPALRKAAAWGTAEAVERLLDAGTAVNARNLGGKTALHDAAVAGNAATASVLLERGANVNATDMEGRTPLHDAAAWRRIHTVKLLLDRGADATLRDRNGQTAEDIARADGGQQLAELIRSASQRRDRGDRAR